MESFALQVVCCLSEFEAAQMILLSDTEAMPLLHQ